MSIVNAQFQDWKGNVYHFETSADMIKGADESFAPLEHNHDDRYYTEKEIDKMADDLKKCVVDGKEKIANAINDKTNDNQMNKDNTFDELADGIRGIKSSGGSYDPYLYLCSLLEDTEFVTESGRYWQHELVFTNKIPEKTNSGFGLWIHRQGIEAGDGRVYNQWACKNKMSYSFSTVPNGDITLGFTPPGDNEYLTNTFYMKQGQLLFCAVGTDQNNNMVDFQKDGFIKLSKDNNAETNGKLVPLITPFQKDISVLVKTYPAGYVNPVWKVGTIKATIMAYQCQEAPLDINLFFKDYHAGTYILIPTYIYRDSVKKYDFPNMI